jgi:hypothetical protein
MIVIVMMTLNDRPRCRTMLVGVHFARPSMFVHEIAEFLFTHIMRVKILVGDSHRTFHRDSSGIPTLFGRLQSVQGELRVLGKTRATRQFGDSMAQGGRTAMWISTFTDRRVPTCPSNMR